MNECAKFLVKIIKQKTGKIVKWVILIKSVFTRSFSWSKLTYQLLTTQFKNNNNTFKAHQQLSWTHSSFSGLLIVFFRYRQHNHRTVICKKPQRRGKPAAGFKPGISAVGLM